MLQKHLIYVLGWFLLIGLTQSCDNGENIGEELRPEDLGVKLVYVDTFTLKGSTVLLDSFITQNTSQLLVGQDESPILGKSKATTYFELLPPTPLENIALIPSDAIAGPFYDSTTINIAFSYAYGQNAMKDSVGMNIYELSERLDTVSNDYYYTDTITKGNLIAEIYPDFRERQTPFYSARVFTALGRGLFNQIAAGNIATQAALSDAFYGVAIEPKEGTTGMYGINATAGTTFFRMHYRYVNSVSDTIVSALSLVPYIRFHSMETDRSNTPLANLSQSSPVDAADLGYQAFIQAGTGIGARFQLPDLSAFSLANKRVVSRAQLLITPVDGVITENTAPPERLFLLENDATGRISIDANGNPVVLNNVVGSNLVINYAPNGQSYEVLDITAYVEGTANGDLEQNGFTLYPAQTGINTFNVLQLGDGRFPNTPIKLRIYYTEFQ